MTYDIKYKKPYRLDHLFPDVDHFVVESKFSFDGSSFIGAKHVQFFSEGKALDDDMVINGSIERMNALIKEFSSIEFEREACEQYFTEEFVQAGACEEYDHFMDR